MRTFHKFFPLDSKTCITLQMEIDSSFNLQLLVLCRLMKNVHVKCSTFTQMRIQSNKLSHNSPKKLIFYLPALKSINIINK